MKLYNIVFSPTGGTQKVALDVGNDKDQAAQQYGDLDHIIEEKLNTAAHPPTCVQSQYRQAIADQSVQPLHS